VPSIRSGLFSGDAIVAAGRKEVFNRVAEARAAAARAGRMRAGRVRGDRIPSPDGSTASGSVVGIARTQTTALVSKKKNFCWYRYRCNDSYFELWLQQNYYPRLHVHLKKKKRASAMVKFWIKGRILIAIYCLDMRSQWLRFVI
jgi:hypothetical protein